VFPDEVRDLQQMTAETTDTEDGYDWRDVARPMPYGLHEGESGPEGETFEWALQANACGDCTFYEETGGKGACTVRDARPLICETYPFSVVLEGDEVGSQPLGQAVDHAGPVRAHECEGLGREISREDAEELATALKKRAVRELEEAIGVRDEYVPANPEAEEVVIHDSEGAKRPDGTQWDESASQSR
jgi:Fe-S-cluster containining protein